MSLGNHHTAALNLTFIHVSFLLVALLTYSHVEKVRTMNFEASTRFEMRTASIFFLNLTHFAFRRLRYKTEVDRRIARLNSLLGNGGILKQGSNNEIHPLMLRN